MPKLKTHRGAAKRFKATGTGKLKRKSAYRRHKLEKKTSRRKRALRQPAVLTPGDQERMHKLLPYA
ncbi:MAG: 50S ribosomal protein L35 [Firmicutes bacterium]|nr:50S ribosomal protein L35 [Bacillota bacterium]